MVLFLISLGTYALRLCLVCVVDVRVRPRSSVGILEEALDLTVDLCKALFLHFTHGSTAVDHCNTLQVPAAVIMILTFLKTTMVPEIKGEEVARSGRGPRL